jgi:hypothetical protein
LRVVDVVESPFASVVDVVDEVVVVVWGVRTTVDPGATIVPGAGSVLATMSVGLAVSGYEVRNPAVLSACDALAMV